MKGNVSVKNTVKGNCPSWGKATFCIDNTVSKFSHVQINMAKLTYDIVYAKGGQRKANRSKTCLV